MAPRNSEVPDGEPLDSELLEVAAGFKQRGPWPKVIAANLLLLTLGFGVPAYRGRVHARESQRSFEHFASCLLNAEPERKGGLAMPPGTRVRFAAQVLHADATWPSACEPMLQTIPPPQATFVLPSIKTAGSDVHAVVSMLSQSLLSLQAARNADTGDLPERPLLIFEKLRAALTLLAEAAGTDDHLHASAVRFDGPTELAEPASLPIMGPQNGQLFLWDTPTGIEAVSADRFGVSWLALSDGSIDRRRARRRGLVRGVVVQEQTPFVIWATPERRCTEREDRCGRRATGIAALNRGSDTLPEPTWLAGHPAVRIDRSVHARGAEVTLLTRGLPGRPISVRRYTLPSLPIDKAPPVAGDVLLTAPAESALLLEPPADALLIDPSPRALVTTVTGGKRLRTTLMTDTTTTVLPPVEGSGAWSVSGPCPDGSTALAYGTTSQFRLTHLPHVGGPPQAKRARARHAAPDPPESSAPMPLSMTAPVLHPDRADRDRVRVLCGTTDVHVIHRDANDSVRSRRCARAGLCDPAIEVASEVTQWDAVLHDNAPVIATAGGEQARHIRVRLPRGPKRLVAAPCWHPRRGFCGQPTLASSKGRLLLASRDLGDLLVMERTRDGRAFRMLEGLKLRDAPQADLSAPMDQHLIRKGLLRAHESRQ